MKYKIGDRVKIKSLDWYYDNRDRIDEVACGNTNFIPDMVKYCEEIVTISFVLTTFEVYHIKEDGGMFNWTDEMIEGLVEEEKVSNVNSITQDRVDKLACKIDEELPSGNPYEWECPEGYIFKDENGNVIEAKKIVLERKKKEYPKTYEECCKVLSLGEDGRLYTKGYKASLIQNFQKLLICRDAYWKIAGEEMGLDKSWKPISAKGYCTYAIIHHTSHIRKSRPCADSALLEFPTEEMRDAFYENFKELINECKELL